MFKRLDDTFRKDSCYKVFFSSILVTGIGYGIYKGIMDNYLADVVAMGELDRGITEFFRELPGFLLVFVLAVLYKLSAESMQKLGGAIMVAGLVMICLIIPNKALVILSIFIYSLGEHIQLGMKNTLSLQYAKEGKGGKALGHQNSLYQIGNLTGFLLIIGVFSLFTSSLGLYKPMFFLSLAFMVIGLILTLKITGSSETDKSKSRFYFRKKYSKYYMLEIFYGARKQVFLTFGPYVLILFYKADARVISLLFAISAISCFILAPVVGQIIDALGYKIVMISDTLILVIVCFFYGYAHHFFPKNVAFIICCANYVLDSIISMASMASNIYVQDLSDNDHEVRATISTGVSVNHFISIIIALFGGYIWQTLGIEMLFTLSAVLGLCNSAYAATIKSPGKAVGKG